MSPNTRLAEVYQPIEIHATSAPRPLRFSLRALMLFVTWAAVCLKITTLSPGLAGPILFVFWLALVRTTIELGRRPASASGPTAGEVTCVYFKSILITVAAIGIVLATLLSIVLVLISLTASVERYHGVLGGVVVILAAAVLCGGLAAAITVYLPRRAEHIGRLSAPQQEQWHDHRSGAALPVPPWKLAREP